MGEEILNTNIDGAFQRLHIKHENFEYNVLPTPQADEYLKFMKRQLLADNPVIWMVMFAGSSRPEPGYTMDNQTNGIYGHIEPVVGILSDYDFSDETVHDDDVFAYFDDSSKKTHYVTASKVPGRCDFSGGKSHCRASCPTGFFGQCLWDQRGYVYAIKDFTDEHDAKPASLSISPFASEPYTRDGKAKPITIFGTLSVSKLEIGSTYDIYRWDSAEDHSSTRMQTRNGRSLLQTTHTHFRIQGFSSATLQHTIASYLPRAAIRLCDSVSVASSIGISGRCNASTCGTIASQSIWR